MPVTYGYPTEEDIESWPEKERLANIEERKRQIVIELDALDKKSIRAIRTNDTERMAQLEAKAVLLRQELANAGS